MDATLERQLDKAWKSTCRVLFSRELAGDLSDYEPYLSEYLMPSATRKSHLSKKPVKLSSDLYPAIAHFVSSDEVEFNQDYKLTINEIKDIDSILSSLRSKAEYTGNLVLGNSSHAENSDLVLNSHFVKGSNNITDSTYIDLSFMMRRNSKYIFGSGWTAESEFMVRSVAGLEDRRVFETHFASKISDAYFCFNCFGCHDIMFSFGQRNKSHMIGNLCLPKEKYLSIKRALISEIAERLEKEKRFPSLLEFVPAPRPKETPSADFQVPKREQSMAKVEKGFASTFKIIFGIEPRGGLLAFEKWLLSGTMEIKEEKTPFGNVTHYPAGMPLFSSMPSGRVLAEYEALALSGIRLSESETTSLDAITRALSKIAFFTAELYEGECSNSIETPLAFNCVNTYRGYESTYSENTALTSLALHSKFVYGCGRIMESEFCIKCFNGLRLKRCLEMDGCTDCSDSYFCHNCEGLTDCMFCFNMKGARNCIGNTQLTREEYMKARDLLLKKMADELDATRGLRMSIYNIGAKR